MSSCLRWTGRNGWIHMRCPKSYSHNFTALLRYLKVSWPMSRIFDIKKKWCFKYPCESPVISVCGDQLWNLTADDFLYWKKLMWKIYVSLPAISSWSRLEWLVYAMWMNAGTQTRKVSDGAKWWYILYVKVVERLHLFSTKSVIDRNRYGDYSVPVEKECCCREWKQWDYSHQLWPQKLGVATLRTYCEATLLSNSVYWYGNLVRVNMLIFPFAILVGKQSKIKGQLEIQISKNARNFHP